jgi:hypothetical protein
VPNSSRNNIVDGTKTITSSLLTGQIRTNLVYNIAPGPIYTLLSRDTYSYTDDLKRSYVVTHLDVHI